MTMRERMAQGKLFTDHCEGLDEERIHCKKAMKALNSVEPDDLPSRKEYMRDLFGTEVNAWIEPPFSCCYGTHILLGDHVYINMNCTFVDDGIIRIGDGTMFGPCVAIATVGHPIRPDMRRYMYTDNVTIGKNCWIGANVTICPGVTIGDNTVIGAGSVVTKDIPSNSVAVGNPCRVLREIGERDFEFYYRNRPFSECGIEFDTDETTLIST